MSRGRTGFGSLWMSLIKNSFGIAKWSIINTRSKRYKINSVFLSQSVNKCWKILDSSRHFENIFSGTESCIHVLFFLYVFFNQTAELDFKLPMCAFAQYLLPSPILLPLLTFRCGQLNNIYALLHCFTDSIDFLPNIYFYLLLCGKRDDI